jgi:two-component system OmpR family sensor kinase
MEPEDGALAFERFWRRNPARSGPGSGLGLSIVAGIAAAHHGSVEMTTLPGRGTKVRVVLPLGRPSSVIVERDTGIAPAE